MLRIVHPIILGLLMLIVSNMLLKSLLKLLLIGQSRRLSKLLLLLNMLLLLRLLLMMMVLLTLLLRLMTLSISHTWVVEVMQGGIDVTNMASPLNHHGSTLNCLGTRRTSWSWSPIHHLCFKVS